MRAILPLAAVCASLVVLPAPAAHAGVAGVVNCDTPVNYPNTSISSARNLSCRKAARDLRAYNGNIDRTFRTPGRFRCHQVSGVPEGGQWRCVKGSRAYRFEFAD